MFRVDCNRTKAVGRAILIAMVLFFFAVGAAAQDASEEGWRVVLPLQSNDLASKQAELLSSSGLSWPDGRQGIVTFWRHENSLYRCIDFFDESYQQTGGACSKPVKD